MFRVRFVVEILAVPQVGRHLRAAAVEDRPHPLGELVVADLAGHLLRRPQRRQIKRSHRRIGAEIGRVQRVRLGVLEDAVVVLVVAEEVLHRLLDLRPVALEEGVVRPTSGVRGSSAGRRRTGRRWRMCRRPSRRGSGPGRSLPSPCRSPASRGRTAPAPGTAGPRRGRSARRGCRCRRSSRRPPSRRIGRRRSGGSSMSPGSRRSVNSRSSSQYGSVESYHVVAPQPRLLRQAIEIVRDMIGDGGRVGEARGVPAADRLAEARQTAGWGSATSPRKSRSPPGPAPASSAGARPPRSRPSSGAVASSPRAARSSNRPGGWSASGSAAAPASPSCRPSRARPIVPKSGRSARTPPRGVVAELDLIDVDVAPRAGRRIHDLDMRPSCRPGRARPSCATPASRCPCRWRCGRSCRPPAG